MPRSFQKFTAHNLPKRTYEEDMEYVTRKTPAMYEVAPGFIPEMRVPARFYVNENLDNLVFSELKQFYTRGDNTGFLPSLRQLANVSSLPGIVKASIGLPDLHSGYGFAIGHVAAFDMATPDSVVSPGGVGFDINCGVRLIRTNLDYEDIKDRKESLAQRLFNHVPVGVGSQGAFRADARAVEEILEMGSDWSVREGFAWAEDKEHCEEYGRMLNADPSKVSARAKKRGALQMGTLGAGNHYTEIQVVEEIYDDAAAAAMGIDRIGQVVVMVHCGSRGLGHQVATDAINRMDSIQGVELGAVETVDRNLACARIQSPLGQEYMAAMSAAANFAWANRNAMTFLVRQAFSHEFDCSPDDLDMQVIYDVSHNIAKIEEHDVDGTNKTLLVHRKGATRAFPPHHPLIPVDYQQVGQPVLIGGTMGTASYVLLGTEKGMRETFGSTCHGAGRAKSRNKSRNELQYQDVLNALEERGIAIRIASPKLIMEEAPESYKNVSDVVETCDTAGISKKALKLRPVAVIKG